MNTALELRRILIVEDDPNIAAPVSRALEHEGFEVVSSPNGTSALQRLEQYVPDLIILDLMLPDMNGMDICRQVLRLRNIPIVMLTACTDEEDRVAGLEAGAADYVTKPFSLRELTVRVKNILFRRAHADFAPAHEFVVGDLRLNLPERRVTVAGREVELTRTEFTIMRVLMENAGRVVTRDRLSRAIWGEEVPDRHLIQVHMSNLRRKIEENPRRPKHILTIRGIGYKIV